jgi:hypothetical protein
MPIVTDPSYRTTIDTDVVGLVTSHTTINDQIRVTSTLVDLFKYSVVFDKLKRLFQTDMGISNGYTFIKDWAKRIGTQDDLVTTLRTTLCHMIADNASGLTAMDKRQITHTFSENCKDKFILSGNIGTLTTGLSAPAESAITARVTATINAFDLYNYVLKIDYLRRGISDISVLNSVNIPETTKTELTNLRTGNDTYYAYEVLGACLSMIDFYIHYTILMWLTEGSLRGGLAQSSSEVSTFRTGTQAQLVVAIRTNAMIPLIQRLIYANKSLRTPHARSVSLFSTSVALKSELNVLDHKLSARNEEMENLKRTLAVLMTIHDKNQKEYEASRIHTLMILGVIFVYVCSLIAFISIDIPSIDTTRKGMMLIVVNGVLALAIILYQLYKAFTVKNSP